MAKQAAINITHLPFNIIPVNTGWQYVVVDPNVAESSPASFTLQCTAGTIAIVKGESVPSDETNIASIDSSTVNKIVFTFKGSDGFWIKPAATTDRIFFSE